MHRLHLLHVLTPLHLLLHGLKHPMLLLLLLLLLLLELYVVLGASKLSCKSVRRVVQWRRR